ncbi:Lsr2 family DNA-binding protein [Streptomyces sp. 4N509B]|uniref:Lsr2 family DNA-binding protein n=1 Tax=Streptomyces sp. 4N509B TaxID=3457413 RepID=UPI003FD1CE00
MQPSDPRLVGSRAPTADPADVRAVMVARGLREPGDDSEPTPPEYRLYAMVQQHEAQMAEIAVRAARREADQAEVAREKKVQERVLTWSWRVQAARAWAQRNGYRVAARGRVPRAVMAAFDEAVEKGELNMSEPPFAVGDLVTHGREPERVGTVASVQPDRYSNEYVTGVRWTPQGPVIPYRSGLTLHTPAAAMKEPTRDA